MTRISRYLITSTLKYLIGSKIMKILQGRNLKRVCMRRQLSKRFILKNPSKKDQSLFRNLSISMLSPFTSLKNRNLL